MDFNDIKTISETSTENNDANTLLILLRITKVLKILIPKLFGIFTNNF